jgi:hypothetical protein
MAGALALQLIPGCHLGGDRATEQTVSPEPEVLAEAQGAPTLASPYLDLPESPVRVVDAYVHRDRLRFEVESQSPEVEARFVDFSVWSYGDVAAIGVSVYDSNGQLKWEMSLETDGSNHQLSEMTGDERLKITRTKLPGCNVLETYELVQGSRRHTREFRFNPSSQNDVDRVAREFGEFWPDQTFLDNNLEGVLAAEMMTSNDLLEWMRNRFPRAGANNAYNSLSGTQVDPMSDFERICIIADLCAMAKCFLGGLVNPLCHACAGVAIACDMARLICMIIGC